MKAGLVGPSYKMRSRPFSAERCINLFPILAESKAKDVAALYGTPGLKLFATAGQGPIRGLITCGNGRTFCVSGNELYEILADKTTVVRGMLSTFNGPVSMAENGLQLMLATSPDGYIFKFADNTLAKITDPDFPGADYVIFQDGFFIIVPPNNMGRFNISKIYDGLSWDALDFATAESSPDGLVSLESVAGQLMLFGVSTTEIWYNNGSADFPFARLSGGRMETGAAAKFSLAKLDNSVFWLGQDKHGSGMVFRANGVTPLRISTQAIEYALAQVIELAGDLSGIIGFPYQQEGHLFYILTGNGMETALVFDAATQLWHERAFLFNGDYERWQAVFHCFAFNQNLTGDRLSGNIYVIDQDTYTDNDQPIRRSRVFSHVFNEGKRFKIASLQVDFDPGVGNAACPDPQAWLRLSKDGGNTWSNEYSAKLGKVGDYLRRVIWRRLGIQREATFEVSVSDPVKVIITGARFNG
ncbi:hypothetical protein J0X19_11785 [Hymenobacter sp. BT186]|uniref:Uncharacterized protein n=1 Tax=Hymenobacter telluris TaxID=2816474 RepID=A0A939EZA7_9BACT|nr:packaged DNA stabilization protein [Hymenobacter telluris]MBO0358628.1 hypothetical protein [Hymenobacter telluris]MBW3374654.1 hypothetical protein [Hymenobacter norwichensis]